ncbi:MAG: hypothetical protein M0Q92_14000 [Methanoregula sp.]|jgi:hypothetical protein|nr:hypothetical protein [Methanoregula sp.]
MKIHTILVIAAVFLACILAAGCTQPQPTVPAPTPTLATPVTPLPVQTPVPETPACSLVPGPTQVVPDYESVSITVDRNTISEDPTITTTFNGGLGLGMIQRMTVTVIRSDCTQDQKLVDDPGIGTSVTQMGTLGTDRVIVVAVMTSGDQYTVIDRDYPFPAQL